MTEKRYVIEEIGNMFRVLKDNEPLTTKFENCDKQDVNNLIAELNELAEENKLHKERISLLSSLLDLADAIIDASDNEKAKQVWDNKNEQTEKEWEKILND